MLTYDLNQAEEKLILACLANNPVAQKELYKRYAPKMFGVCLRYAMDRDQAADLLQEGFIKVFDKLASFKKEGSFEGWIRRIMVNTALEHYRKRNHLYVISIDDVDIIDETNEEEEDLLFQLEITEVVKIMQQLSPGYRMVLNLYAMEGFSHKEIANHLGISEGTSKSQLARARAVLVEKIRNSLSKKVLRET